MLVAYIAGPFRSATYYGIWCNVRAAEQVALKYWKLGYAVICPHTNTANFDGAVPKENDQLWLDGDIEIMKRCDVVIAMASWEKSSGAKAELQIAKDCGLKIIYDELGDGEPSPEAKSFIDLRREFADQEWIPSCYMDDGRGGLLLENNTIVLGVGAGFNYEAVKKMATEHNANLRSGAAQEVSPKCKSCGTILYRTLGEKGEYCDRCESRREVSPPSPACESNSDHISSAGSCQ